jgi:DNA helicase-2/ATP-dependent DNA helicase PcrA
MTAHNDETDSAEIEERTHLAMIEDCLHQALREADTRLTHYARDIQAQKKYLWEARTDMDHIEKISTRESIQQAVTSGEMVSAHKQRLLKTLVSPYFGRFDFARAGRSTPEPVYVGVHHFYDEVDRKNQIYDWRAPIATLFYDFETGPVRYTAPEGEIEGEVSLKRQFRIKHGQIELMIDSAVNVVDDVLQEELSRASDDSMKNIVATIQRDQNAIIRDEYAQELIIQGVAGSGKTSIALHRIAFLLYRFKDTLSSEDILIISPNSVFADYISNVLPELGEESVNEIGMDTLANELLDSQYRFQTFFEQTAALLEKNDEETKQRIRFKASLAFLKKLGEYAVHVDNTRFVAEDLWVARRLVPGWLLEELFHKHRALNTTERINRVIMQTEQKIGIQYHYDLLLEERKELRAAVRKMLHQSSLRETYKQFYSWLGKPEMFKPAKNSKLEYADVFPLIYLKMQLEGIHSVYKNIKHLLIDEMQDYTPVQYAVLAKIFPCKKTILGDANQSINPYSSSTTEEIQQVFGQASCVKLNTSYRSSYEITRFAQRILPDPDLVAMERHDEEPHVLQYKTRRDELAQIDRSTRDFFASDHNTLGIIYKTQKQAQQIADYLCNTGHKAQLLSEQSRLFTPGVIVCTAHMAKGLEFDRVIVPDADAKTYHTAMDRHLLYVACTRAMHKLTVIHTGELTPLIQPVKQN